jgi:hypothetical protein
MVKEPIKKRSSRRDVGRVLRFLEELSWLLDTYNDLDFRALGDLRNTMVHLQPSSINRLERYVPHNPNIMYLVGTLPELFTDTTLFPSNEDIAEFATVALHVEIPRWHKKSKFELERHPI